MLSDMLRRSESIDAESTSNLIQEKTLQLSHHNMCQGQVQMSGVGQSSNVHKLLCLVNKNFTGKAIRGNIIRLIKSET